MDHGKVAEQGSYDELIAKEGEFSRLMTSYGGVEKEDESSSSQQADTKEVKEKEEAVANEGLKAIKDRLHKYHDKAGKELMTVEERETGTVKWDVWKAYITAGGGIPMLMLVLVALGITTGLAAINNYWLVYCKEGGRWVE